MRNPGLFAFLWEKNVGLCVQLVVICMDNVVRGRSTFRW